MTNKRNKVVLVKSTKRKRRSNKTKATNFPQGVPFAPPKSVVSASSNSQKLLKRRVPRSKRRTGKYLVANGGLNLPNYPIGLMDPFSLNAQMTGIPDPDISDCIRYNYKDVFTLSSDSAYGIGCMILSPDPYMLSVQAYVTAGTTWSWVTASHSTTLRGIGGTTVDSIAGTASLSTLMTSLVNGYAAWRMVNGGIKICCPNGSTTAGMVTVSQFLFDPYRGAVTGAGAGNGFDASFPISFADVFHQKNMVRVPISSLTVDEVVSVFKPSSPNAYDYRSMNTPHFHGQTVPLPATAASYIDTGASLGIPFIAVLVSGCAAATSVLDIEVCINYEFMPAAHAGSTNPADLKPEPSRPQVMAATETMVADAPDSRIIDDGGVAEEGFVASMEKAWGTACRVANSVGEVASALNAISAFV